MRARFAALATLLLASCYYGAPDSVVNGALVATQYASGVSWDAYTTFSVDPKVAVLDNTGSVTTECTVDGTNLVTTITQQMQARGYTAVDWGNSVTGPATDIQIKMTSYLGSVDYYYSGYYCGWYPYYYCYPSWTYAGSYSFGTLVLDMGDLKNATSGGKLPLIWHSASYGVLASYYTGCANTSTINWGRVQQSIVQAFDQSPYIQSAP